MVSEIPSDRPIVKTTASSDKTPPQTPVRLSQVQAEVASSIKIATSAVKTDAAPVTQEGASQSPTTQPKSGSSPPPQHPTNKQSTLSQPPPEPRPPQKDLYNATVVFNRQAGTYSTPPPATPVATQLTTDVIQRINQGLLTIVRITTDLPLLKGDQLIVNSSPNNALGTTPGASSSTAVPATTHTQAITPHLELQQLLSIPSKQKIQQTIINLVRLLVPTQNSYSPLLNNILSLVSSKPELLKQLPPNIQQAIKQISQHLPNTESLRTAETVKQAIKHSGVLFESSLKHQSFNPQPLNPQSLNPLSPKASLLGTPQSTPQIKLSNTSPSITTNATPSATANTVATNTANTGNIPSNNLTANTTGNIPNTAASTNKGTPQQPSSNNTSHALDPKDFKHQLLTLEKALLSATKQTTTLAPPPSVTVKPSLSASVMSDPTKIIQKTALTATPTTATTPTASTSSTSTLAMPEPPQNGSAQRGTALSEKQQLQNLMQLARAQQIATESPSTKQQPNNVSNPRNVAKTTPPTSNASPPLKPLAIQTYQTASSQNTASLQGIPPLPGQYLIQAQANMKATLKGDDVADALIKILLKQTQESISRLQLHQLSTAAAHADDGPHITQAPLSFDLPILHFGQLTLFHFHIEEELQKNNEEKEKSSDKKWNVSMGFDIEGLGAMFCELSLINTHVYVKFWAKEKDTVSRAKVYFDVLQKNLHQIGATVKELECIEGLPPQQESSIKPSLIDIET